MPQLRVLLLGPPRLESRRSPLEISRRKGLAMIAYLAVTGEPVSRESLTALLWPKYDGARARAALRRTLSIVKKELPPDTLKAIRYSLQLAQADRVRVDARDFSNKLKLGIQAGPSPAGLGLLREAAALYRSDFMTGFSLPDSQEFDDWQSIQGQSLQRQMRETLERLVLWQAASGNMKEALACAARWLQFDPLSETVHRQIIKLRAWAGQRSEAIRQFHQCKQLLREELGVQPEAETVALFQDLLQGRIPEAPRFAGLEGAAAALQTDPPKPSGQSPPPEIRSLPIRGLSSLDRNAPFVGRSRELQLIGQRLQKDDCRLLTVLGPGGIGKSRLAVRAAQQFADRFPDGTVFVPLASTASPQALLPTIAEHIRLPMEGDLDPRRQLIHHLRDRQMLLVLDNFEHLLDSAPLLDEIITCCVRVQILVTSRARLQLTSEWLIELEGLSFPSRDKLQAAGNYESVQLFAEYAGRHCSQFKPSAEEMADLASICRQVSGMPLAIELIAPWIRVLSLREIRRQISSSLELLCSRMDDRPERHRSLKHVFEASCSLLTVEETEAFLNLSVFQGGFTQQAAQRVAGAGTLTLFQLIDKSFIQRHDERYEMHPLLQRYARSRLKRRPARDTQARMRQARYYAAFLHQCVPDLRGLQMRQTLEAIAQDFDNISTAWEWAVEQGCKSLIQKSMEGLYRYCMIRSRFSEGRRLLEKALGADFKETDSSFRARLGVRLARLKTGEGDLRGTRRVLQECLKSLSKRKAPREYASARSQLGLLDILHGNYPQALRNLEESLQIYRGIQDQRGIAQCMIWLGRAVAEQGDFKRSSEFFRQGSQAFQAVGDLRGVARCWTNLGNVCMLSDKPEQALSLYKKSQSLYDSIGNRIGAGISLGNLGIYVRHRGEHQQAQAYFMQAKAIFEEAGLEKSTLYLRLLMNVCKTYIAIGEAEKFRETIRRYLAIATKLSALPSLLAGLATIAVFLAKERPSLLTFELAAFVAAQSTAEKEVKDMAKKAQADLSARLQPAQIAKARRSARKKPLQEILDQVLGELQQEAPSNQPAAPLAAIQ